MTQRPSIRPSVTARPSVHLPVLSPTWIFSFIHSSTMHWQTYSARFGHASANQGLRSGGDCPPRWRSETNCVLLMNACAARTSCLWIDRLSGYSTFYHLRWSTSLWACPCAVNLIWLLSYLIPRTTRTKISEHCVNYHNWITLCSLASTFVRKPAHSDFSSYLNFKLTDEFVVYNELYIKYYVTVQVHMSFDFFKPCIVSVLEKQRISIWTQCLTNR